MSGQAGPPPPRIVSQYRCNRTADRETSAPIWAWFQNAISPGRSTTSAASRNAATGGCGPCCMRPPTSDPLQGAAQAQELGLCDRRRSTMRMMIARRRARAMRVFRMREGSSIAATKAGSVRRLADMAASHVTLKLSSGSGGAWFLQSQTV
jgi:hypothetical protein